MNSFLRLNIPLASRRFAPFISFFIIFLITLTAGTASAFAVVWTCTTATAMPLSVPFSISNTVPYSIRRWTSAFWSLFPLFTFTTRSALHLTTTSTVRFPVLRTVFLTGTTAATFFSFRTLFFTHTFTSRITRTWAAAPFACTSATFFSWRRASACRFAGAMATGLALFFLFRCTWPRARMRTCRSRCSLLWSSRAVITWWSYLAWCSPTSSITTPWSTPTSAITVSVSPWTRAGTRITPCFITVSF